VKEHRGDTTQKRGERLKGLANIVGKDQGEKKNEDDKDESKSIRLVRKKKEGKEVVARGKAKHCRINRPVKNGDKGTEGAGRVPPENSAALIKEGTSLNKPMGSEGQHRRQGGRKKSRG